MVRPRRSSAASDESGGAVRDQVCFSCIGEIRDANMETGTGKHV
jgi:hypothetical protein